MPTTGGFGFWVGAALADGDAAAAAAGAAGIAQARRRAASGGLGRFSSFMGEPPFRQVGVRRGQRGTDGGNHRAKATPAIAAAKPASISQAVRRSQQSFDLRGRAL